MKQIIQSNGLYYFSASAAKTKATAANPMSREELERHLESKQPIFSDIEKAPALLPMEIFSNDNSNLDR